MDQYAKEQIATIPEESRVLVTAHDAFSYFGHAYGFEVMGLQGISTDSEYGLKDVQELVDILVDHKIKAVFVESSISEKSINAVVEGAKKQNHQVVLVGSYILMQWVKKERKKEHISGCLSITLTPLFLH